MIDWIIRYWIGGLITLSFIDGINYLTNKHNGTERFNNWELIWVFLFWPLIALVFVTTYLISFFRYK